MTVREALEKIEDLQMKWKALSAAYNTFNTHEINKVEMVIVGDMMDEIEKEIDRLNDKIDKTNLVTTR